MFFCIGNLFLNSSEHQTIILSNSYFLLLKFFNRNDIYFKLPNEVFEDMSITIAILY